MSLDILKTITSGLDMLSKQEQEKERESVGVLRGGSVGCLVSDSSDLEEAITKGRFEVVGNCARKAHARFLGWHSGETSLSLKVMFAGGHGNEAIWAKWLEAAGIVFDLEAPIIWDINGVRATGRRDILIYSDESKKTPILGIELKKVSALNTAKTVSIKAEPKLDHLIQAGNYSYRSGDLPYQLWYTSYDNFTGAPYQFDAGIPKRGQAGSEFVTYSMGYTADIKDRRTGKMKKGFRSKKVYKKDQDQSNEFLEKMYGVTDFQFNYLNPFIVGYEIRWSHDTLEWRRAATMDKWTTTPITKRGIDAYYSLVATCGERRVLPPIQMNIDAYGEVMKWSMEDYSELKHINDMIADLPAEQQYSKWLELLKTHEQLLVKRS